MDNLWFDLLVHGLHWKLCAGSKIILNRKLVPRKIFTTPAFNTWWARPVCAYPRALDIANDYTLCTVSAVPCRHGLSQITRNKAQTFRLHTTFSCHAVQAQHTLLMRKYHKEWPVYIQCPVFLLSIIKNADRECIDGQQTLSTDTTYGYVLYLDRLFTVSLVTTLVNIQ